MVILPGLGLVIGVVLGRRAVQRKPILRGRWRTAWLDRDAIGASSEKWLKGKARDDLSPRSERIRVEWDWPALPECCQEELGGEHGDRQRVA
jgi:hypothetical protein